MESFRSVTLFRPMLEDIFIPNTTCSLLPASLMWILYWVWLFHGCFRQDLEKVLDVFNITLARQQAQMEVNLNTLQLNPVWLQRSLTCDPLLLLFIQVMRSGQKLVGKKAVGGQKQGGGGFFSSIFGRKAKKEEQEVEESSGKESKWLTDPHHGETQNR